MLLVLLACTTSPTSFPVDYAVAWCEWSARCDDGIGRYGEACPATALSASDLSSKRCEKDWNQAAAEACLKGWEAACPDPEDTGAEIPPVLDCATLCDP